MGITEQILIDHTARNDWEGVTWFTEADLARLGIREALFTVMQTVQHTLRMRKARQVVESHGSTDRWSVEDAH